MTAGPSDPLAPSASALLVNWNTRDRLIDSLEALRPRAAGPAPTLPIVVVDNASSDGSAALVRARYPDITLLANQTNRGYGAAVNQGMAALRTPYVFVANADARATPTAIQRLRLFLDQHPRAAIAGPALLNPDGSLQLSWGREPHFFTEAQQRWWWRRLERAAGQPDLRRYAREARPVDWVLGAAFLVRQAAFNAVGGMDEGYFMYFEEADLCSRLRRTGWEVWYAPVAQVTHVGRASTSQARDEMAVAYRRSQLRYYRRFHGAAAGMLLHGYWWLTLNRSTAGRRLLRALAP